MFLGFDAAKLQKSEGKTKYILFFSLFSVNLYRKLTLTMANLKILAKDTAIYGLSSIVGRFINYLLVPLYTHYMPKASGDYGVSTNMYAYTALMFVVLTFGMETTLFRFANDEHEKPDTVFSTAFAVVGSLTALFLILVFRFITPISSSLGYAEHPEYMLMMASVPAAICSSMSSAIFG